MLFDLGAVGGMAATALIHKVDVDLIWINASQLGSASKSWLVRPDIDCILYYIIVLYYIDIMIFFLHPLSMNITYCRYGTKRDTVRIMSHFQTPKDQIQLVIYINIFLYIPCCS